MLKKSVKKYNLLFKEKKKIIFLCMMRTENDYGKLKIYIYV